MEQCRNLVAMGNFIADFEGDCGGPSSHLKHRVAQIFSRISLNTGLTRRQARQCNAKAHCWSQRGRSNADCSWKNAHYREELGRNEVGKITPEAKNHADQCDSGRNDKSEIAASSAVIPSMNQEEAHHNKGGWLYVEL